MKSQLDETNNPAVKESHRRLHKLDEGYWMGYFWWIINYENGINKKDGVKSYRHDGGVIGTRNIMLIYPEHNLGISIFTNVVEPTVFDKLSKLGFLLYGDLKDTDINTPKKPTLKKHKISSNISKVDEEKTLNNAGYRLLNAGKVNEAIETFKLLVSKFPNSANAYGSLAEAYDKDNNKEMTLENYQKSLKLNPENSHAAQEIDKIKYPTMD